MIQKACRSPKDAETIVLGQVADVSINAWRQLEQINFRKAGENRFKARLFTDSSGKIQSVASSKQVERRFMRPDVNILKQHLEDQRIEFIAWVPDELQVSDVLTKDSK